MDRGREDLAMMRYDQCAWLLKPRLPINLNRKWSKELYLDQLTLCKPTSARKPHLFPHKSSISETCFPHIHNTRNQDGTRTCSPIVSNSKNSPKTSTHHNNFQQKTSPSLSKKLTDSNIYINCKPIKKQ